MYTIEKLSKINEFSTFSKNIDLETLLDPLTGVLNRKSMKTYCSYLVSNKIPFRLAMIDIDNFKNINDKYGHTIGDRVLVNVAEDLSNFIDDNGVVGRFGGDEFVFVVFGCNEYDQMHDYCKAMYKSFNVFRKELDLDDVKIFITATLGTSSFPEDANDLENLFINVDKTLYRGKNKGRNCYIIYVEDKHKELNFDTLTRDDEATIHFNINTIFNSNTSSFNRLTESANYLKNCMLLDNIFFINNKNELFDLTNNKLLAYDIDLSKVKFNHDITKTNYQSDIKKINIKLSHELAKFDIYSTLVCKMRFGSETYGYIILALKRIAKIWQNDEISILLFYAKEIILDFIEQKKH